MSSLPSSLVFSAVVALAASGCAGDSSGSAECVAGKCDSVDETGDGGPGGTPACNVSGIENNRDPIAELLIRAGDSCPQNVLEMVQKLDQVAPCPQGPGLQTSFVSDGARFVGGPESYRTVSTRTCGDETDHALFFTLLGVRVGDKVQDRTFVEMMAFDPESQLYNFYTHSGGNFRFEGTSIDAIEGRISCGGCHNQGGPIMKELDEPWVHWDSEHVLPGVDELLAGEPEHGNRRSAELLEAVIKGGNDELNVARTQHYSAPGTASVRRLLEPLFCSAELNLDTAGEAPDADISRIPGELVLDDVLAELLGVSTGDLSMSQSAYDDTVSRLGQSVSGFPEENDTAFKFLFAERAHVEHSAVRELIAQDIIDEDFAADVLSIDFTRPLQSGPRCDLLRFAPELDAADIAPETIRAGFIDAISADATAGSAAQELLVALQNPGDRAAHKDAVEGFLSACRARPEQELMDDLFRANESVRDSIRFMSIIENPTQVPRSEVAVSDPFRLSADDCTATSAID